MLKIAAAVLAAFISGCAALPPPLQPQASQVDTVVGEAVLAARAPASEQAAALARAEQALANGGAPVDRLRLATMLAALPPPLRDDARAAQLLRPLSDGASPGIGRFAAMLAAQIAERQRLVLELERAARETERVTRETERVMREAERNARERDKREEALKQQLEALRTIERNILEREEKLRRRPLR